MNTIVYLSRHSNKETDYGITKTNENLLQEDIRRTLTIEGEENAKLMANYNELKNIDIVWSSHFSRAISTAKYVAFNNNLKINIDDRLGERIVGYDSNFSKLTPEFVMKQYADENYKYGHGESRKEVQERMNTVLFEIINENKGKNIFITTHCYAIIYLFISLGKLEYKDGSVKIMINDKNVLENMAWGNHTPELFKLVFDENNNLNNVERIYW